MKAFILILLLWLFHIEAIADAQENNKADIAKEITFLFSSVKRVILDEQPLINDASIANKNLSAEIVIQKAMENYPSIAGKAFAFSSDPTLAQAQRDLLDAVAVVMNEAQPLINVKGIGFKGFITAIFARSLAKEFSNNSPSIMIKFTAPIDLLRSARNMPDEWESKVFDERFRHQNWGQNKSFSEQTSKGFRWMTPVYHEPPCLNCHGEPKGQKDIVGFTKEGAKLGDLAGAFSVIVM